jgi:hypothetical protein
MQAGPELFLVIPAAAAGSASASAENSGADQQDYHNDDQDDPDPSVSPFEKTAASFIFRHDIHPFPSNNYSISMAFALGPHPLPQNSNRNRMMKKRTVQLLNIPLLNKPSLHLSDTVNTSLAGLPPLALLYHIQYCLYVLQQALYRGIRGK